MSENYVPNYRGDTPTSKIYVKDESVTPIEEDFGEHNNLDASIQLEYGGMRKSMFMSDIASLTSDLMKLEYHNEHADHRHRRVSGTGEPSKTKFVSMAQAVYHNQRDTPARFDFNRPRKIVSNGYKGPTGLTIPQSAMLRCRGRSRPHHILSQKEREEMEVEEVKKFKIKANPVPKAVIEGCRNLPAVPKKLSTVPEPLHLTVVNKKLARSPMPIQAFKARPAPKHILEKPQICPKQPIPVRIPVTSKFHYKPPTHEHHSYKELPKRIQKHEKPVRIGPVKPVPFSFDKRDEELKRRHDERVKKQLEEERKQACQFKAQPLPGAVKKRMQTTTVKCGSSSASSENKENRIKFEARPPVVLYKEPVKPVLKPVQIVKPAPFQLNTEKRERFDRTLKEKEDEQERLRQQREREIREAEKRANAEVRAKLVHHPKPVPDTYRKDL